jgi:CDP-diacylglycerol---glycerol-3-phosphate 3-phosphatidyltransferase
MTEDTKNTIINLPNMITIFRIVLVPVLFLLIFFSPGKLQSFFAGLVFSVASISDCVDGYLARRMNLVTDFGKFLDPLADKLLVGVALIMMIPLGRVPLWIVVIILGREVMVTLLRVISLKNGNTVIEASMTGKYKTGFQIAAIIPLLFHYEYNLGLNYFNFSVNFHVVGMAFLYAALILTIWTGVDYLYKFFKMSSKS